MLDVMQHAVPCMKQCYAMPCHVLHSMLKPMNCKELKKYMSAFAQVTLLY